MEHDRLHVHGTTDQCGDADDVRRAEWIFGQFPCVDQKKDARKEESTSRLPEINSRRSTGSSALFDLRPTDTNM